MGGISKGRRYSPVGAGLLAKAVYQAHIQRLTLRIREQARSHRLLVVDILIAEVLLLDLRISAIGLDGGDAFVDQRA